MKRDEDLTRWLICPSAKTFGDTSPCHYAMNPNCSPDSPGDVVLLFESWGGWSQHGGAELLARGRHDGDGLNICFNDGHVELVRPEDLNDLRWE